MKTAVIVLSAHVKLNSLEYCKSYVQDCGQVIILSSSIFYENERKIIETILGNTIFLSFADLMSDEEGEFCDSEAFKPFQLNNDLKLSSMYKYFHSLTKMKNEMLKNKIEERYSPDIKLVISDDLGIDLSVWKNANYLFVECEYYSSRTAFLKRLIVNHLSKNVLFWIAKKLYINYPRDLHVAYYNGQKYIFHGHLQRAGYRINLKFEESKLETFKHWINKLLYVLFRIRYERKNTIHLTTLHEYGNYAYYEMMDIPEFHNYLIQDGLLPCNDCCKYLFFYGRNSKFYTWDKLGNMVFDYHKIPSEIMPFRITCPIPTPMFRKIKRVLCVSSGAGDWTAIKNRSDEERTVEAIVEIARRYPQIEFVYRCHPSWVSASIQGVNSIQRLAEYLDYLKLPNIKVSSNIPSIVDKSGGMVVSHKRSSLEADLKESDLVFGVHSISMVDGAMEGIPFASINMSGRRNLFQSITDLGFPHCESVDEIANVIESFNTVNFQQKYIQAVDNYNSIISKV